MLAKQYRIRKSPEYKQIFLHSKKLALNLGTLYFHIRQANSQIDSPRFGIICAKTVGKAVVRNKIRRQVREILRLEIPKLRNDFDLSIVIKPQAPELEFAKLKTELIAALQKLNCYK